MNWFVYLLRCCDGSLYCGVTTDPCRRLREHNDSNKGARYTRVRRPVTLVYQQPCDDKASAYRREYEIKQMSRTQKMALIAAQTATQDNA